MRFNQSARSVLIGLVFFGLVMTTLPASAAPFSVQTGAGFAGLTHWVGVVVEFIKSPLISLKAVAPPPHPGFSGGGAGMLINPDGVS